MDTEDSNQWAGTILTCRCSQVLCSWYVSSKQAWQACRTSGWWRNAAHLEPFFFLLTGEICDTETKRRDKGGSWAQPACYSRLYQCLLIHSLTQIFATSLHSYIIAHSYTIIHSCGTIPRIWEKTVTPRQTSHRCAFDCLVFTAPNNRQKCSTVCY